MPVPLKDLIKSYDILVRGIDSKAHDDENRAYGGIVRAGKGLLVESIAKHLVEIAWHQLGEPSSRLSFDRETVKIPLNRPYIARIKSREVAEYITEHIDEYTYGLKTDIHVAIDGSFVIGVECKAYTENAMLKRILVDFTLLRHVFPALKCVLVQLESQLTGDYSQLSKEVIYGSRSTHTILSYFDIDLNIITLLEGERHVDKPIHKKEYFKPLQEPHMQRAADALQDLLREFV